MKAWKLILIVVGAIGAVYLLMMWVSRKSYAHGHSQGMQGERSNPPAIPTVIIAPAPAASDGSFTIAAGHGAQSGWSYNGTTHLWTSPAGVTSVYGPPA